MLTLTGAHSLGRLEAAPLSYRLLAASIRTWPGRSPRLLEGLIGRNLVAIHRVRPWHGHGLADSLSVQSPPWRIKSASCRNPDGEIEQRKQTAVAASSRNLHGSAGRRAGSAHCHDSDVTHSRCDRCTDHPIHPPLPSSGVVTSLSLPAHDRRALVWPIAPIDGTDRVRGQWHSRGSRRSRPSPMQRRGGKRRER